MKRFVTILAILAAVTVAVLAVVAYWLEQELDTLKRKLMTAPARAARWKKEKPDPEPEQEIEHEPEPGTLNNVVENEKA